MEGRSEIGWLLPGTKSKSLLDFTLEQWFPEPYFFKQNNFFFLNMKAQPMKQLKVTLLLCEDGVVIMNLSHTGPPVYPGLWSHRVLEKPVGNQCFGVKRYTSSRLLWMATVSKSYTSLFVCRQPCGPHILRVKLKITKQTRRDNGQNNWPL